MDFQPKYVVVNLETILKDFSANQEYYYLYRLFPLPDMVKTIICADMSSDDFNANLWHEIERKIGDDNIDEFDLESIDFFFNLLAETIYSHLRQKLYKLDDKEKYSFEKWVSNTDMLLKLYE